ncbi:MAG: GHKL domain-containing protein [Roseburia sp.]|nr:GHKL domain-containing protein [Roseburia sp.]
MELSCTLFVNFLSALILLLLMKYGFGVNFRLNFRGFLLASLVFFAYDFLLESFAPPLVETLGLHFFLLAVLLFTLPKHSFKKAFCLIPASAFYAQLDGVVELLARHFGISGCAVPTLEGPVEVAVVLADCLWILCLICLALQVEKRELTLSITLGEGIFLTMLGVAFPFYDIFYSYLENGSKGFKTSLWIFFCLGLNISIFAYFFHKQKTNHYHNLSEAYREYYNAQYAQFSAYKKSQARQDRFRHDQDNHFLVMQEILSGKEYDKAAAYMEQLTKTRDTDFFPVFTGNEILDMLIKMKYQKICDLNISIRIVNSLDVISHMDPVDICIIFSNAIDNAMESCEKVTGNRYIELGAKKFSCHTMVCMKNPVSDKGRDKKTFFHTDKEDKNLHGFGISNMRETLKKYHGTLSYEQRGDTLITRILLSDV